MNESSSNNENYLSENKTVNSTILNLCLLHFYTDHRASEYDRCDVFLYLNQLNKLITHLSNSFFVVFSSKNCRTNSKGISTA